MDIDFTPRNVAKYVAKSIVYLKVTQITEDAITDYTRFEEDDLVVRIVPKVVAWAVSDKLKPVTDKVVDKTADYIVAKREARASKKDNTTEK
jgi:hypothetical protein